MRKKALTFTLALVLSVMCGLTAWARGDMNDMVGVVISNRDGLLSVADQREPDLEWTCLVSEADVFDLLTGLPAEPEAMAEGSYIRVFEAGNRPVIWINCFEEGAAAFKATVSENIQYFDNACNFLTCDEKYRVTLTPETVIYDPDTGFIGPSDILPGQEMFVWLDMVTASCPAQAYPDQVVLIK
jgi:hypothetical protein